MSKNKQGLQPIVGCYVLLLHSTRQISVTVGKFGQLDFSPGYYAYVGSAFGSGGIKARVGRHLSTSASQHWHIDYIKSVMDVVEVWLVYTSLRCEHICAQVCSQMPSASAPHKGFGSSDCQCESHLFFYAKQPKFSTFKRRLSGLKEISSQVKRGDLTICRVVDKD